MISISFSSALPHYSLSYSSIFHWSVKSLYLSIFSSSFSRVADPKAPITTAAISDHFFDDYSLFWIFIATFEPWAYSYMFFCLSNFRNKSIISSSIWNFWVSVTGLIHPCSLLSISYYFTVFLLPLRFLPLLLADELIWPRCLKSV